MEDISLHILDIAENSISAGATVIKIRIIEDASKDIFTVEIEDNGRGIPADIIEKVLDPFYTTRTTRKVGFGLSLLAQSAKEAGGDIHIKTRDNTGTTITAYFKHSHIDRKPLGNIADTIIVLIAGNPDIDFVFTYDKNKNTYCLDTCQIKAELDGIPINLPPVISAIRKDLQGYMDIVTG